jgi:RNA polymerase sigma factor (sigma-70 family)
MVGAAFAVGGAKATAAVSCDKAVADVQRYCSACWRNARIPTDSWSDCTQEVICRLMQTVPLKQWDRLLQAEGDERREFVRAIDAVKKRSQRSRKYAPLNEDVAERRDRTGVDLTVERREDMNKAAAEVLSYRQQRIIEMSIEGYTVQEMADALRMSPERVSDEKYKAIRKLRSHLGVEV